MILKDKIYRIFEYVGEYSIYALIFFIPTAKAAIEIFFGFALLSFVVRKIIRPEFNFLKTLPNIFLLAFFIFMGVSLFNSGPYLQKSLIALFFKWLKYIAMYVVVQDTFSKRVHIRNALIIFLFISMVVGIDGLSQKFAGVEFIKNNPAPGKMDIELFPIRGPFNHYNDFGAYLVIALSLVSALLFYRKLKIGYRIGLAGVFILLLCCLVLTFSRGAALGFLVALIFILFLSRRLKTYISLSIVILLIGLFLFSPLRERLIRTIEAGGDPARYLIWQAAFTMIKEHPFLGKGLGTFMDYFPQYVCGLGSQYAHNCYLQIWAESGIFALLAFVIFVFLIIFKAVKSFFVNNDFVILGLTAGVVGFLVHSLFDTHLYSLQLAALFWIMLGILARRISPQLPKNVN